MAKWADYLISGVWFSGGTKNVSHVQIHVDNGDSIGPGQKRSSAEVIASIKAGRTFKTIVWNYSSGAFNPGAEVGYVTEGGREYLRTHRDRTVTDNLDNMLNMDILL